MLKKIFLSIVLLSAPMSGNCSSEFIPRIKTKAIDSEQFQNLKSTQHTHLSNSIVLGHAKINGNFQSKNNQIRSLKVNGYCSLENTKILKKAYIIGNLTTKQTEICGTLTTKAAALKSEQSQFAKIIVETSPEQKESPTITLRDETVVLGDIEFVNTPGHVQIDETSSIAGEVIGGVVEFI